MKSKVKLKFSKAHLAEGEGIVNSMSSYYYRENRPDSIRFRVYMDSYTLSSDIQSIIDKLPQVDKLPVDYSRDSGMNTIPAKQVMPFLDLLAKLTATYSEHLYISKNDFHKLMKDLVDNGYLNLEQVANYSKLIPVEYMLEDMEKDAKITKDADLALTIACRYKEEKNSDAQIYWLSQARIFNKEHPFFTTQGNVSASLKGIKSATINYLFNQGDRADWLLDEIAACPTLEKLYFGTFFSPVCINTTFANFLIKSKHVKELDMGATWSADAWDRMRAEHAQILATGLRLNHSVEYLDVSDQRIGDKGLIAIVDALVANPETKLTRLNLFCSGITDLGAQYLLEKIDNLPSLRNINLRDNSGCNKNMIATIEAKLTAREEANQKLAETIDTTINTNEDVNRNTSITETGVASVVTHSMFSTKAKPTDKVAISTPSETLEDETRYSVM